MAFLVPATMITEATIRRRMLTQRQMDILAKVLLGVVVAVVVCSAVFGFKFAWPTNGEARSAISHPMWLNYPISICAATVVPFIFAWFYQNSAWALMAASVAAGMALYPVSLNKTTFLAPYWPLALAGLIKFARARVAVLLTLLIPMLIGIVAFGLESPDKKPIFGLINFRMLAIPGSGLDHYYHYFSTHPLTHFCQVSIVGRLFNCALRDRARCHHGQRLRARQLQRIVIRRRGHSLGRCLVRASDGARVRFHHRCGQHRLQRIASGFCFPLECHPGADLDERATVRDHGDPRRSLDVSAVVRVPETKRFRLLAPLDAPIFDDGCGGLGGVSARC